MRSASRNLSRDASRRIAALSEDHRRGITRFSERLETFLQSGLLSAGQIAVVIEHLIRLGERDRNPANTGNIEDLFCHTLLDTGDSVRAYAQALADSVKVVPMDPDARLRPHMRCLKTGRTFRRVGDLDHLSAGDGMLVTHTMVAYGDDEMWASAASLVRATHPRADDATVEREVARMAVQSQHHPSSTFVLARAHGLSLDVAELYEAAGYDAGQVRDAQGFYDICGEFDPRWSDDFVIGQIPEDRTWTEWRLRYMEARRRLPMELVYQLSSDTLTNFLEGTLESGKWTDASVFFGGVTDPDQVPGAIARIVNQYIAEHIGLHDGQARELTVACAGTLGPWGIGFENDRAVVQETSPEKQEALRAQFLAAWNRKQGT